MNPMDMTWFMINKKLGGAAASAEFCGLQNLWLSGLPLRAGSFTSRFCIHGAWTDDDTITSYEGLLATAAAPISVVPSDLRSSGYIYMAQEKGVVGGTVEDRWVESTAEKFGGVELNPRMPGDAVEDDMDAGSCNYNTSHQPIITKAGQNVFALMFAAPQATVDGGGGGSTFSFSAVGDEGGGGGGGGGEGGPMLDFTNATGGGGGGGAFSFSAGSGGGGGGEDGGGDGSSSGPPPSSCAMHAAYPMQMLVRVDKKRRRLVYDCFEAAPKRVSLKHTPLPTWREMKLADKCLNMGGEGGSFFYESDDEDDPRLDTPIELREGADKTDHTVRFPLELRASAGHFMQSRAYRVAVPLDAVVGARLHCPAPDDATGGVEMAGLFDMPLHAGWKRGVLVLELGTPPEAAAAEDAADGEGCVFAVRRVSSPQTIDNKWHKLDDWTPGAVASRATRHYIVGKPSELKELAAYLATCSPKLAAMLGPASEGDAQAGDAAAAANTLAGPDVDLRMAAAPLFRTATLSAAGQGTLQGLAAGAIVAAGGTADAVAEAGHPPAVVTEVREAEKRAKREARRSARSSRLTVDEVYAAMREHCGIKEPEEHGSGFCLKRAWLLGHQPLPTSAADLDRVLTTTQCTECLKDLTCTVRGALGQSDYGGDCSCGADGASVCDDCECGVYVTGLCEGRVDIDSGKFHNHCVDCPEFGVCCGDYRTRHCEVCGNHYYSGGGGGFPCSSCGASSSMFSLPKRRGKSPLEEPHPTSWPGNTTVDDSAKEFNAEMPSLVRQLLAATQAKVDEGGGGGSGGEPSRLSMLHEHLVALNQAMGEGGDNSDGSQFMAALGQVMGGVPPPGQAADGESGGPPPCAQQ